MNNLYYHNVSNITQTKEGYVLEKFNPTAYAGLSEKGKGNIHSFHGSEIRFVASNPVTIHLKSFSTSEIMVYYGDFQGEFYTINQELSLVITPKFSDSDIKKLLPFHRFHPSVIRILFKESLIVESIIGDHYVPSRLLMPEKRYLAYGTSITQGRSSYLPDLNYPMIIGEKLGYDVFNMGMSGSCYIEKSLVDEMLKTKYDLITLELSVNMIGDGFHVDTFKERLSYLLEQIRITQPNAVVVCMSVLDNWRMYGLDQNRGNKDDVILYRNAFKEIVKGYPNYRYIDGSGVLSKHHLSFDLIHPGHYGMIEIANHIVKEIEKML